MSRYFDKTLVQGEVVSDRVLPALFVISVVRESLHDELIDLTQCQSLVGTVPYRHSNQCIVTKRRLGKFGWLFDWGCVSMVTTTVAMVTTSVAMVTARSVCGGRRLANISTLCITITRGCLDEVVNTKGCTFLALLLLRKHNLVRGYL